MGGDAAASKLTRKYRAPLYSVAWLPPGDEDADVAPILVGGGGGGGKHGVKNLLIVAEYSHDNAELSDEVYSLESDEASQLLALHPGGDGVLCAFETGCKLYSFQPEDEKMLEPCEKDLSILASKEPQKLVFSMDGKYLAAGGEGVGLRVFTWSSMTVVLERREGEGMDIRDADFSVDNTFLATTSAGSPLRIWNVGKNALAASLKSQTGSIIGLCRFSRDSTDSLFTTMIKAGDGYLCRWSTAPWDDPSRWRPGSLLRVHTSPISAFAISQSGDVLATGTPEGDLAIVGTNGGNLHMLRKIRSAHSFFVAAIEFGPDDRVVASVSGDTSVRITPVPAARTSSGALVYLLFFFVILLMIAVAMDVSGFSKKILG